MIRKIVVGIDFNPLSTAALRLAGAIAARTGAAITAVYADTFEPPAEFTSAQVRRIASAIETSKRRAGEQLEADVTSHVPGTVKWKAVVAEGAPANVLPSLAIEEGADLIVLGTHGRGGLPRLVLGSVAEAVIRESSVPVLTVRSREAPPPMRRILCAAPAAQEAAARLAAAIGAEVTMLEQGTDPLVAAQEGACDLIAIAADRRLVADVMRHATVPVLTAPEARRES